MQTNRKTRMTRWFFSRGSRACQHASPRCVDRSRGGSVTNWRHLPSSHVGHCKNLPTGEGSSMTHFNRVALHGSRGTSTMPLTKLFSRALHKCWYELNAHKIIRLSASAQIVYRCSTSHGSILECCYLYFITGRNVWETKPMLKPLRSK
jgi:hypothetical protein